MLAYGPSEAPLTPPHSKPGAFKKFIPQKAGPAYILRSTAFVISRNGQSSPRTPAHVCQAEGTEVVSQCHVSRGAHPVDCHHLARRLDDDQVLELEDMFDQDTCRLSWGARDRRSVHKWADRASPRLIGTFVYTVGLWEILRATIVYTDGGIGPLRAGLGRLCTLLGCGLGLWVALESQ
mgnify:CR=1 FL=1